MELSRFLCVLLFVASVNCRTASICEVTLVDFCNNIPTPPTPSRAASISGTVAPLCPADPTITLAQTQYSFDEFNVISFDSFFAVSADVEGRVAVRNNLAIGEYSIGFEIGSDANDVQLPFALVVGGDADWSSGAIYPQGNNVPYHAPKEYIFVGGTFTAPLYLQNDRTGSCQNPGCLNSDFDVARTYYQSLSSAWAIQSINVVESIQYGKLTLTCIDSSATSYVASLTGSEFSQITDYQLDNCNSDAQIVINIVGNDDVTFAGDHIKYRAERVLYNIIGTGRKITVQTQVNGSILASTNDLYQSSGVIVGQVIVGDILQAHQINRLHCRSNTVTPNPNPGLSEQTCAEFITDCAGLTMNVGGYLLNLAEYDVVSFGDFNAQYGDIEGRLAARNNVNIGFGWSVGYMIHSKPSDFSEKWTFIVGHDATWGSGWAYPDGSGIPYLGTKEDLFVGSNFDAPAYLQDRRTGSCNGNTGCLDASFDYAKLCYDGFSATLAAEVSNVQVDVYWSGLFLTCNDKTATHYTFTITTAQMQAYTYIAAFTNCNEHASWTINIAGPGDVTFSGGSFPVSDCSKVTYNIIGSNRLVSITSTSLCGHLLAHDDTVDQTGGVIIGRVVAGDFHRSVQINRPNCTDTPSVTTQSLPITSGAVTTKAFTSAAITSAAVTSSPVTSRDVTSAAVTSSALTTGSFTSSQLTTQPITSAAVTSSPLTTQPVTSSPLTTQPVTSSPLTTQPASSQFLTTQPITSSPLTTKDITTQPLTTQAVTSAALTTSPLTTQPVTSAPLSTQPVTSSPLTTSPLTTQPVTSSPLTTQPVTSSPLTTQQLTTQPLTTQPLTTKDITTQPLTTRELTTSPLTTKDITTQPLTTRALTTKDITTQDLTTQPLTTKDITTQELTTQGLTTQPVTTRRRPSK